MPLNVRDGPLARSAPLRVTTDAGVGVGVGAGAAVGAAVAVGSAVGAALGEAVDFGAGVAVGDTDGVGSADGAVDATGVGEVTGACVGWDVGATLGAWKRNGHDCRTRSAAAARAGCRYESETSEEHGARASSYNAAARRVIHVIASMIEI
jgi:hypothetical protein